MDRDADASSAAAGRVLRALLLLLLLLAATRSPAASAPCPRLCSCPQPAELHCTFRSLVTVPAAVSTQVKRMNLGFNRIGQITDESFAGLGNLELLLVHGNDIHSLPDGAFQDLVSLQMLKASYNKLKEINRRTLRGLRALARLHLDHNRLEFVHPDAFQGLASLRLLQLEGNRLRQLHPATFATFTLLGRFHVSTLRHLHLSDNGLTSLPAGVLASAPRLESLYLHGNPWRCDCGMRWLHDWDRKSPGVLKCKKDRALPGGQLCPTCSSPRRLQREELQTVTDLSCSGAVISSPDRTSPPGDAESEVLDAKDFADPFGNVSLGLSDEHGNEVDLDCRVGELGEFPKTNWEQVGQLQLVSNVTLSVDMECPVDRGKYEKLWRLIAYYSNVPAHLQRGVMVRGAPHLTYAYRQDSEKDAVYYTGVRANITAQPAWLMQASADLQLNRPRSSARTVSLTLTTELSETAEAWQGPGQERAWVVIDASTRTTLVAVPGSPSRLDCDVRGSGPAAVRWTLPDGSEVEAPHGGPDDRVSVSAEGRLVIRAVSHADAGTYYCVARVGGDLAVLPFHLNVQESSGPPPGEHAAVAPVEGVAGSPLSLPCVTSGSPDAEISWILPSSDIVSFHGNTSRVLVYSNGTLHIPQTQLSDGGHYKCIAMNQHGVDTLVTRVTLVRRKGLIRPLRKFPARPQSASGVNTRIKVPTEDAEEASGDVEVTPAVVPMSRVDPPRRRIPGGAMAPGRRGVHPSRNAWRRPPMLRKAMGSRVADGRRTINVSKGRVNSERWVDFLAKVRDRNAQGPATPLPVPTARMMRENADESSDTVTVWGKEGPDDVTPPPQHVLATSSSHAATLVATSSGQRATKSARHVQHTTPAGHAEPHATVTGVFLPPTTSVPPNAVTLWQANANTDGDGAAMSRDVDGSDRSQIIPSTTPVGSGTNRAGSGKYLTAAASWPPVVTPNDARPRATLTTALPTTAAVPASARRRVSGRKNGGRGRKPRRRKQKLTEPTTPANAPPATAGTTAAASQLAVTPVGVTATSFNTTIPSSGSRATSPGAISSSSAAAVCETDNGVSPLSEPFPTASPGPRHGSTTTPATSGTAGTSPPAERAVSVTSATLRGSTGGSSPPPAPPSEADVVDATGGFDSPQRSDNSSLGFTAVKQAQTDGQMDNFGRHYKPAEKFGETPPSSSATAGLIERELKTTTVHTSSALFTTPDPLFQGDLDEELATTKNPTTPETWLHSKSSESGDGLYASPSPDAMPSSTAGPYIMPPPTAANTSPPPRATAPPENRGRDQETVDQSTDKRRLHHPTSPAVRPTSSRTTPAPTSAATQAGVLPTGTRGPEAVMSSTAALYVTPPPTAVNTSPPPRATDERRIHHPTSPAVRPTSSLTTPAPASAATQAGILPTGPDVVPSSTAAPHGTPPSTAANTSPWPRAADERRIPRPTSPAVGPTSSLTTPAPASAATRLPVGSTPALPERGPAPRGRPRITQGGSRTYAVKAEADARLPCEAEGEPRPFLSWTQVASGVSVAQNTRIQRFEVHPNGTLVIRKTQPTDGGRYLCAVQNQHGTDEMAVNLVVLSQPPRVLQPRQRDVTAPPGGSVDLDCAAEGHPAPRIAWVLPSRAHAAPLGAAPQQRVSILSNGTLRISQATHADQGIYKCIGSSAAGSDTVAVHLRVTASPPAIRQAQNESVTLPEGAAAYIHCTATGAPQPLVRWVTPDGVQLIASQLVTGHNPFVLANGTLHIQGLGPRNAGRYECLASNTVASSRRTVILSVRRNPSSAKASITVASPQRTDVIYGGTLLLDCVATGDPEPRIIWRTPSKKLVDAQYSFDSRIKVFPNGTITVRAVTDKDGGDYLCVARNRMGDDFVPLRVDVLKRPAEIKRTQLQSSQEVIYGGDLKVDCVASGLPDPEISWALPDGTMVNPNKQSGSGSWGRSRRYVVFDNGTLYFSDVGMPEEGDYTCYAENQLGKDEMKVRVRVKAATSSPRIRDKDQMVVRVFYGETVTLRCNAKGMAMPVVTWISPANRVISPALDKYQILDDGTLVVQKVQRFDGGNYTCMVRNNAGQDHNVIRLEVLVTAPAINGLSGTANAVKVAAVQDQQKFVDCVAKGTPAPRVMWVLPGNVILPAPYHSNRMTVHQNGTLEIRSPKKTDSGQLVCIARNEGGEVRLVVDLDVKDGAERPQVGGPGTESLSLSVRNAMTLNCTFDGSAPPPVTWILPNGKPLHSGAQFSKFFHRPDGSLIIANPSVADAGTYRCLGRNGQGRLEQTITLSPGRKPQISNRYNAPVSVMIGERLLLHCIANGEPVGLTWTLPSGVVLNRPQRAGRYAVLANGTLAIQQVSAYDRGSYVCRGANEYGSSLLPVSVTVIAYPPRITSGPAPVTYAKRGVAIQLNCVAAGLPKVDLAWEMPDKARLAVGAQPRLFGNKYLHPQGSLVIQHPTQRDAGVYRCTARNAIGTDSKATFLNVF